VAVGAGEGLVFMQQCLNAVGSGGQVRQRRQGVTDGIGIEGYGGTGLPVLHIHAEDLARIRAVGDLETGLALGGRG